ncbi:hypothetical protein OHA21_06180 [Actinoplanes sp. NBC_00393]|uniref:hypothetical protein n=1 Tax=Actinoplanes sp. NBC_00393 TaxID=2975953 RepID=UPI002E23ED67
MTRGRSWTIVAVLAGTVGTLLVAVLGWGPESLEKVSWVAGILALAATLVIALATPGGRPAASPEPASRSGAGAVLAAGVLASLLIVVMVVGVVAVLAS